MSDEDKLDPVVRLGRMIADARTRGEVDPNAATLATVDPAFGQPSVRTVYIHALEDALAFFINSRSGKGRQLEWHPHAALCFFWRGLQQQVCVEGVAQVLDAAAADALWAQRSRESKLAARSSRQESLFGDPANYRERVNADRKAHGFEHLERPEHWIGYRLVPSRIEFWATGWHRGHCRELFEIAPDGGWQEAVLEP